MWGREQTPADWGHRAHLPPRQPPRVEQKQSDMAPQGREWFCSLANVLKSCNVPSSPGASSQPPLGLASTNGGPGVCVSACPTGLLLSQKPQGEAPAPHTHSPSKSPSSPSKPSLESSPGSGLMPRPQSPRCCCPVPTAALPPPARPVCVGRSDRVQPSQTLQRPPAAWELWEALPWATARCHLGLPPHSCLLSR